MLETMKNNLRVFVCMVGVSVACGSLHAMQRKEELSFSVREAEEGYRLEVESDGAGAAEQPSLLCRCREAIRRSAKAAAGPALVISSVALAVASVALEAYVEGGD